MGDRMTHTLHSFLQVLKFLHVQLSKKAYYCLGHECRRDGYRRGGTRASASVETVSLPNSGVDSVGPMSESELTRSATDGAVSEFGVEEVSNCQLVTSELSGALLP